MVLFNSLPAFPSQQPLKKQGGKLSSNFLDFSGVGQGDQLVVPALRASHEGEVECKYENTCVAPKEGPEEATPTLATVNSFG